MRTAPQVAARISSLEALSRPAGPGPAVIARRLAAARSGRYCSLLN